MESFSINNLNNNNINYKKYIIGNMILYIPLIVFNIMVYIQMKNINNLINTPENMDYINKIKHLIDDVCNIVNCSRTQ